MIAGASMGMMLGPANTDAINRATAAAEIEVDVPQKVTLGLATESPLAPA